MSGKLGELTLGTVDREIAAGSATLLFSPALETRYEADTGAARNRYFIRTTQLAAVLFNLFLLTDYLMTPDVFMIAVVGRVGLFTPCLMIAWFIFSRNPRPYLREGVASVATTLSVVQTMVVLTSSRCPDMVLYQAGDVLIMVFAAVVQRLRIRFSIMTIVGIAAVQLGFASRLSEMTPRLMIFTAVFFFTAATLLLWAAYALERAERRSYLLNLRNLLLNDQLDTASKQDALTGLWNRRHLETVMSSAWAGAAEQPRDMSVILLDIDEFKLFNDTYGHLEGDKCLRGLAASVSGAIDGEARVCAVRFGGEEFLVFMDGVGTLAARQVAERIAAAIKAAAIPHPVLGESRIVTASLGVATGSAPGLPMNKLVAAADEALYDAKRAGRDRVTAVLVAPETSSYDTAVPLSIAS